MNSFLFYFIIFSCLAFENFSKRCCDWCDESCCDWCDKTKYNEEYFLNSGYNINVPLNLKWSRYKNGWNCSAIAVFRFILSDKVLLEILLNENKKTLNENLNLDQDSMILSNTLSKISQLFKNILKSKNNYNDMMYDIINSLKINDIFACGEILDRCLYIYFKNLFKIEQTFHTLYQDKNSKNFKIADSTSFDVFRFFCFHDETYILKQLREKYNKTKEEAEEIIKKLTENNTKVIKDEINTSEYLCLSSDGFGCFKKPNVNGKEIENWEKISITQKNGAIKEYELIGLIGLCGEIVYTSVSRTDTVLIVPVYDKNKNEKGWVKYQFNEVSKVHDLTYWKNVNNFNGWENPVFFKYIYKCTNQN